MKSTLSIVTIIFSSCMPLFTSGQQLREGVVNVLIDENFKDQKIHSAFRINGRDVIDFSHPVGKRIFSKYNVTKYERTYPGVEKYDHPHAKILSRYYTVEGSFRRDKVMYDIIKDGREIFEDVEPKAMEIPAYTPNDYDLHAPFTIANLDLVRAKLAWNLTKGSRSIKVAVTDPRGFFFAHPDYVNSDGSNQILFSSPAANNQVFTGTSRDHGLSVASVVAMATGNNLGMSALGYNTGVMAFSSGVNEMLSASYDHGANIVEASWFVSDCAFTPSHQLIMDMIHDNGTTIIAASANGNRGSSCPSSDGEENGLVYPASYNHVISVGGVDTSDKYTKIEGGMVKHHTFNEAVDLTAPAWNVGIARVTINSGGTAVQDYTYTQGSGTSFAAPMVAALAGLILSYKPDLSPDAVEFILKSTAVNVDNLPGNAVYAGLAGSGRIDAYAAVSRAYQCYGCEDVYYLPENPDDQFLPAASIEGCQIQIADYEIQPGDTYEVTATRQITLGTGFSASAGSNVRFKINDICVPPSSANSNVRSNKSEIQHVSYRELIESGQIEIPEEELPEIKTYKINSYPNPAKDDIVIEFTLETASYVNLQIQDLSGNTVSTIINEFKEAGDHEVGYNVSGLAQGIYLSVLKSNHEKKLGRLVVVH